MHDSLKSSLSFPDYYGKNLDALNDCLWGDLIVPHGGGLVVVLNHYDSFARAIQINDSEGRSFAQIVCSMSWLVLSGITCCAEGDSRFE